MTNQGPGLEGQAIDAMAFWRGLGVKPSAGAVVTAQETDGPRGFPAFPVAHLAANPSIIERHGAVIAIGRLTDFAGSDEDPLLFSQGSDQ